MQIDIYSIPIIVAKAYKRLIHKELPPLHCRILRLLSDNRCLTTCAPEVGTERQDIWSQDALAALKYLDSLWPDEGRSSIKKVSTGHNTREFDLHIIVPVYNDENHILDCLNSIVGQTSDFKVLVTVVDDGSTDSTPGKLNEFVKKKNGTTVEVMSQHNSGHSGARNAGLKNLRGEYVMFVDSDDKLEDNAIQCMLMQARKTDADIVGGGYRCINESGEVVSTYLPSGEDQHGFPWGKVYRASLFEQVEFPLKYWFEDTVIGSVIVPLAKSISNVKCSVYRYLLNSNGITSKSAGQPKVLDSIYITLRLLQDRDTLGIKMNQKYYDSLLYQIRMNQWRGGSLKNRRVDKALFAISADLLSKYNYRTENKELQLLEWALRKRSFAAYLMGCV